MNMKNEKGVTLIELLAVLVLVSMVATIILTTFFIATKYNINETKKLKMQQEANFIITAILQKHRTTEECYNLDIIEGGKKLVFIDCEEPDLEVVIGESFKYELTSASNEVYPKQADLKTTLTVSDSENPKLFVSVDTIFKRFINN